MFTLLPSPFRLRSRFGFAPLSDPIARKIRRLLLVYSIEYSGFVRPRIRINLRDDRTRAVCRRPSTAPRRVRRQDQGSLELVDKSILGRPTYPNILVAE